MLISQCHFDGPPLELMGPYAGPAEANGLPEAHGPSKVHGPRGHCTPCPRNSRPPPCTVFSATSIRTKYNTKLRTTTYLVEQNPKRLRVSLNLNIYVLNTRFQDRLVMKGKKDAAYLASFCLFVFFHLTFFMFSFRRKFLEL